MTKVNMSAEELSKLAEQLKEIVDVASSRILKMHFRTIKAAGYRVYYLEYSLLAYICSRTGRKLATCAMRIRTFERTQELSSRTARKLDA